MAKRKLPEEPWPKKAPKTDWHTQRRLSGGGESYDPAPMPSDEDIDAVLARIKASRPLTPADPSPKS